MTKIKILIWDEEGAPPAFEGVVVLWQGFATKDNKQVVSIPEKIEEHAIEIRSRYLAWIYELGETQVGTKRLVDQLAVRSNFSYWWMTLLVQKCNYSKSPHINEAIRLIAFCLWFASYDQPVDQVELVTDNKRLKQCFKLWAEDHGVDLMARSPAALNRHILSSFKLSQLIPHFLRAICWLPYRLWFVWSLKGVGLKEWKASTGKISFFSYLTNLNVEAKTQGRYATNYWGPLPDLLLSKEVHTNWLHLYVQDQSVPNARRAAELIRCFNKEGKGFQCHVTLYSFLSFFIVSKTLLDWIHLAYNGLRVSYKLRSRRHINEHFLEPLFRSDWRESLFGIEAISNVLHFNLFEAAVKQLPKQDKGVYLQENQSWEFGLVYAWKTQGHKQLIGAPHSTVRFWDLRYFFDPRSYAQTDSRCVPMPVSVAVTGKNMLHAYQIGGYPARNLIEVEALRYLYLTNMSSVGTEQTATPHDERRTLRILVLCDYWPSRASRQLTLLAGAIQNLSDIDIIVKSHPSNLIDPLAYPTIPMRMTMEPIGDLLSNCDVAYSSEMTSAAVDAYCLGCPVVSVLDPHTLNLSPLRGCEGIIFVSTSQELKSALLSKDSTKRSPDVRQEFFILDPQLPRWKHLLLQTQP